jgi:hypothetical protein
MRKEIKEINLPQLIVGLDSQDDNANYIHINDVKENVDYYCPCCKGLIKPRAYKKDEKYKMQPHFYHINGGCTEETYIHYICKNFLFQAGSKFIVNNVEYEVKEVIIENGFNTKFGVYIPDITVITTSDKIIYFEISNTNKKTSDYIPKWDELGNDIVEVDVKQFVNQKFKNDIPIFKLIYSNGNCFIREYIRRDYEEIERRKLEWKRQDKLNYKIKWERLDWFWRELQEYKHMKCSEENIIDAFKNLPFEDMSFCWNIIHNHKLTQIDNECLKICNSEFDHNLLIKNITYNKIKPYTYIFSVQVSKYIDSSTTCMTHRKKVKDIELFNKIIKELYIEQRDKVKEYLFDLNDIILNDIQNISIYHDLYYIRFKSDKYYENGVSVQYNELLNDKILEYYHDRKIKRYEKYKSNKKQLMSLHDNDMKYNQIKYKRSKYIDLINDVCSEINNCKNKQWHCSWNWNNKIDIKVTLWFDCNKEYEINNPYYDYNYSLSFTIKEPMLRELKCVIAEYMNKLYNMVGIKSIKCSKYEFTYNRFGTSDYRKLIIDREVINE